MEEIPQRELRVEFLLPLLVDYQIIYVTLEEIPQRELRDNYTVTVTMAALLLVTCYIGRNPTKGVKRT